MHEVVFEGASNQYNLYNTHSSWAVIECHVNHAINTNQAFKSKKVVYSETTFHSLLIISIHHLNQNTSSITFAINNHLINLPLLTNRLLIIPIPDMNCLSGQIFPGVAYWCQIYPAE